MINVTAWLAFLAGLLSFVSPCVLPLVPAYVGYMSNRLTAQAMVGQVGAANSLTVRAIPNQRFQMALHGLAFVAGFTFVFVVFGLAVNAGTRLLASTAYETQRVVIPHVGGILIILFGLHFLGILVPVLHRLEGWPVWDRMGNVGRYVKRILAYLQAVLYADTRVSLRTNRAYGLMGSGLMGVIFSAGWTPCIGPIYGTILTMAASGSDSVIRVGGLLTLYSFGLGIPFILTAVALDRAQEVLRRLKRSLNVIKIASGVLLIVIGILVYTGTLQRISQFGAANSAVFMYKLEGCVVDVTAGKLAVGSIGDCVAKQ